MNPDRSAVESGTGIRHAIDAEVRLYDHLFETPDAMDVPEGGSFLDNLNANSLEVLTDCKVEAALADTAPGEVVQFERIGYFAHDPREPMLFHRTVGLRDEWANIQKRRSRSV